MAKNVAYYSEKTLVKFMNCKHFTLLPEKEGQED